MPSSAYNLYLFSLRVVFSSSGSLTHIYVYKNICKLHTLCQCETLSQERFRHVLLCNSANSTLQDSCSDRRKCGIRGMNCSNTDGQARLLCLLKSRYNRRGKKRASSGGKRRWKAATRVDYISWHTGFYHNVHVLRDFDQVDRQCLLRLSNQSTTEYPLRT